MNLFNKQLSSEQDWEAVFQSTSAFTPLTEHILIKENLPIAHIEILSPGTNAVFKAGEYVIKIFAPAESKVEQRLPETEIFATQRANALGIPAPKVITSGVVEDRYRFAYLIIEYIEGAELGEAVKTMTDAEKIACGQQLRAITDKMNTPCETSNAMDTIHADYYYHCWDEYPEPFQAERLAYIKSHSYGQNVFVHGDLYGGNIILTPQGKLYLIDFADAILAPKVYEHARIALESELDPMLLQGYFANYTDDEITEICLAGLLILDYDPEIIEEILGKPEAFQTLDGLRKKINRFWQKDQNGPS